MLLFTKRYIIKHDSANTCSGEKDSTHCHLIFYKYMHCVLTLYLNSLNIYFTVQRQAQYWKKRRKRRRKYELKQ